MCVASRRYSKEHLSVTKRFGRMGVLDGIGRKKEPVIAEPHAMLSLFLVFFYVC